MNDNNSYYLSNNDNINNEEKSYSDEFAPTEFIPFDDSLTVKQFAMRLINLQRYEGNYGPKNEEEAIDFANDLDALYEHKDDIYAFYLKILIKYNIIDDQLIDALTDLNFCKTHFGMRSPMLNENGRSPYYYKKDDKQIVNCLCLPNSPNRLNGYNIKKYVSKFPNTAIAHRLAQSLSEFKKILKLQKKYFVKVPYFEYAGEYPSINNKLLNDGLECDLEQAPVIPAIIIKDKTVSPNKYYIYLNNKFIQQGDTFFIKNDHPNLNCFVFHYEDTISAFDRTKNTCTINLGSLIMYTNSFSVSAYKMFLSSKNSKQIKYKSYYDKYIVSFINDLIANMRTRSHICWGAGIYNFDYDTKVINLTTPTAVGNLFHKCAQLYLENPAIFNGKGAKDIADYIVTNKLTQIKDFNGNLVDVDDKAKDTTGKIETVANMLYEYFIGKQNYIFSNFKTNVTYKKTEKIIARIMLPSGIPQNVLFWGKVDVLGVNKSNKNTTILDYKTKQNPKAEAEAEAEDIKELILYEYILKEDIFGCQASNVDKTIHQISNYWDNNRHIKSPIITEFGVKKLEELEENENPTKDLSSFATGVMNFINYLRDAYNSKDTNILDNSKINADLFDKFKEYIDAGSKTSSTSAQSSTSTQP